MFQALSHPLIPKASGYSELSFPHLLRHRLPPKETKRGNGAVIINLRDGRKPITSPIKELFPSMASSQPPPHPPIPQASENPPPIPMSPAPPIENSCLLPLHFIVRRLETGRESDQ
ncbi:hypothetical protein Ancab_008450 [Ancistrocladus abbreviatus]